MHYGEEEWKALPAGERSWFDYLCGNHTRNLPLDEWNREFERYIKDELGEAIAEVQKTGGRSDKGRGQRDTVVARNVPAYTLRFVPLHLFVLMTRQPIPLHPLPIT